MDVCIVGNSGHAGSAIAPCKKLKDVRYTGYCPGSAGESLAHLEGFFAKNGLTPERFGSYTEMVQALHPDILVVDSVFCDHYKILKYALENKIHVYCEKPLALNLEDCRNIPQLVKSSGKMLWSMQTMRYDSPMFTAKQLLLQGKVGKIRMITAQKSYKLGNRAPFYSDRSQYGGTIPWVAIHAIDLIQYFGEKKFESVYAASSRTDNGGNGDMESTALCCFKMQDDVLAQLSADFYRPENAPTHGDDRIRIVGTNGILEVRGGQVYLIDAEHDGSTPLEQVEAPLIFEDFVNSIRNAGGWLDTQQSYAATYVALMARESADTGKLLTLQY